MRGVAGMVLMTAFATGCLVTDVLEEQTTPLPADNTAPRIVRDSVSPEPWNIVLINNDTPRGCELSLTIGIVEDDEGDDLEVRWFVDFWLDGRPRNTTKIYKSNGMLGTGWSDIDYTDWGEGGIHVVRAIVSDGFADSSWTKAAEGHATVEQTWTIDTTQAASCPRPVDGGFR